MVLSIFLLASCGKSSLLKQQDELTTNKSAGDKSDPVKDPNPARICAEEATSQLEYIQKCGDDDKSLLGTWKLIAGDGCEWKMNSGNRSPIKDVSFNADNSCLAADDQETSPCGWMTHPDTLTEARFLHFEKGTNATPDDFLGIYPWASSQWTYSFNEEGHLLLPDPRFSNYPGAPQTCEYIKAEQ